ncbi:MAG: hypothetical protein JSV89_19430 [Spirochaetaceae bacterium]|nr:MAG: hypothetical protein JSV89_19430 [Spirochaetaceae bacterium]
MATSILATKLYIPAYRSGLVPRPRLIEQLHEGLVHKMTLISAPAGYGKTTLVCEMLHDLQEDAVKASHGTMGIAWLSLDEGDNDRERFLTHLITALNSIEAVGAVIGKEALAMLHTPKPPASEAVLTSLINDIAKIAAKVILTLDDYHLIESTQVDGIVSFLLDHMPDSLHLVIATRSDPNLPLARLRAVSELTEIRARDLRFSLSEVADFLERFVGLDFTSEDIAAMEALTEGWIVGLQLAALSLRGRDDAANSIGQFTANHKFIMDYLFEEVLNRQTEKVQEFLIRTSVLNRLTASLCDAVSDQDGGREILEMLERMNLFIIALDNERYWYRYHHLFQELLRQRLNRIYPAKGKELHRRAAVWWDENGYIDQAIEHALYCRDPEWAASMLEAHIDALWHHGEGMVVWGWIRRLPVEVVDSKPMLCIIRGYYLHGSGEQEGAERSLQLAEQLINTGETKSRGGKKLSILKGKLAVTRALMLALWGELRETMRYSGQALEYLPENELGWRALAAIARSEMQAFLCDTAAAIEIHSEALSASKKAGNNYFRVTASLRLAGTLYEQGRLQEALEICRQQLRFVEEHGLSDWPTAGSIYLMLAEILAQTGEMENALANVNTGISLDERGEYLPVRGCWDYFIFMRVLISFSDFSRIEEKIQKMRVLAQKSKSPVWIGVLAEAWQARVWLAQERTDMAARWLADRGLEADCDSSDFNIFRMFECIVCIRVLIATSKLEEAGRLLSRLHGFAQTNGMVATEIEILILTALAQQAAGNPTEAQSAVDRALELAEKGGFIRIFVDEGPPLARLICEAAARGVSSDHMRRVLAAFPTVEQEKVKSPTDQKNDFELIEPLSDRELEILRLISEGLTNQQIGTKLFISLNTVKTHTRNIYAKLETHTRTQTVSRARGLGLLPLV